MTENSNFQERLLEDLYLVFGDVGTCARTLDFLCRSLSLSGEYVQQLAGNLISEGYAKETHSGGLVGFTLTHSGAQFFARRFLGIPGALLNRPMSATAISALVDHVYERHRGRDLKVLLRSAFRTERYPVFRQATKSRLYDLLEDNNAPYRCAYNYRLAKEMLHPGRFSGDLYSMRERDSIRRVLREEGVLTDLEMSSDSAASIETRRPGPDLTQLAEMKQQLVRLEVLPPQKRGLAFEAFLTRLFALFGLSPREPFRLRGEQIDGSFQLQSDVYLVEAKWQREPVDQNALLILREKVESKSAWSRGLFVSYGGFSVPGLEQYSKGRATNIIGMSGQDLVIILEGRFGLIEAIQRKARRAAECGDFFVPLAHL